MKRTVPPPLLLLLILVLVHAPAHSEENQRSEMPRPQSALTKAIVEVSPSVVQIGVVFRDYPEATKKVLEEIPGTAWNERSRCPDPCVFFDQPMGTGFLVNEDGYVITAKHVMDALHNFKLLYHGVPLDLGHSVASVRVQMPSIGEIGENGSALPPGPTYRGAFWATEFEEINEDPIHDLALLKLKYNPFTVDAVLSTPKGPVKIVHVASVKFSLARPDEGEPIAVSGYPLSLPALVTTSGAIASAWEVAEKDLPREVPGWFTSHLSDSYLADMHVSHGNSGGPIYSVADGSVIGVCVSILPDSLSNAPYSSGLSLMVPAKYVVELLRKNHLKWTETTPSPP